MRLMRALLVAIFVVAIAGQVAMPAASASSTSASIGAGLRGPSGLEASVYAKELKHLSGITTDPEGHVWAATAAATDKGTDGIYEITATGATPLEVITDAHTPLGILWVGDSLYVARSGGVDRYDGFNGTVFASKTTLVTFPTGVGEVNGIAYGSDGRFVVGISAPCDHCTPMKNLSATVVSFLPDGTDLQVMASGIRAAVGLTYYPGTDDLFVTMNQRDDLGAKTPGDWLSVVSAGQNWRFPACHGQGGTACTGVPAPVAALDTHAAVSGVAIFTGQLGNAVGTAAAVAEWVTGKVQLVALTKSGSTYTGRIEGAITGFKNPMPVFLSPTGALFVGDWTTGKIIRITT